MSKMGTCDKYKHNLISLIDIFTEMFEEGKECGMIENSYPHLFSMCKLIMSRSNGEKLIFKFITKTYEHWDKIHDKDLEYFKEFGLNLFDVYENKGIDHFKDGEYKNTSLVSSLSEQHVEDFKQIMSSGVDIDGEIKTILNEERLDEIWTIFHSFVKLSIIHIHEKRKKIDGKYTIEYFPNISVAKNSEKWSIKKIN